MVAFPDVLTLLNRDVRWTTDLGNAFLAQQADVMNAVQRMRSRASENGRLTSTPQQTVTENQSAIEIQPTNPQVIYVPSYNPQYVWGPPAGGAYPSLGYGYGFGFNPGVLIGALFSGLMSFGGWGWGLNWLAHALFLNNLFFGHFGFGGFGGGLGARSAWVHNPAHRMGVAYSNRMVASRFSSGRSAGARSFNSAPHAPTGGWQRAGQSRAYSTAAPRSYGSLNRGVDGSRYNSPGQSYRASSSNYRSPASSYRAPASHYSAPKMNSHNSAPRSSHMKAPHMSSPRGHSSGHSSGGHGGKHK
jgi:hypothetical protein